MIDSALPATRREADDARLRPPRKGEGKQAVAHGCTNTPPVIGSFTPVVLGNVIGSPLRLRTARYANACASRKAEDQPTASAVVTSAPAYRLSSFKSSPLRAPPPATTQRTGGSGAKSRARTAARAVKAASGAAPSSVERWPTMR